MNWTISKKMLVMAAVVLVGLGTVSGLSFRTNSAIEATFAELDRRSQEIAALDGMETDLLRLRLAVMEFIDAGKGGSDSRGDQTTIEATAARLRETAGSLGAMADNDNDNERRLAEALQKETEGITAASLELVSLVESGAPWEQINNLDMRIDRYGEASVKQLGGFASEIRGEVAAAQQAMRGGIAQGATLTWVVGLACLAILGSAFFLLARGIIGPLRRAGEMLKKIEGGHLDMRLHQAGSDEIAQLGRTLDAFAESLQQEVVVPLQQLAAGDLTFKAVPRDGEDLLRGALQKLGVDLREMLGQIQEAGQQIASGSAQVADASQSLSQGATESAASLEEVSSSLNEMTSQVADTAENADQASRLAGEVQLAAELGNAHVQNMAGAMAEINQASREISKIIKVIDEIAFQTNLLALNAAVEAARAGQHGKGFAVVAEEVRSLAARSAKAAKETETLIAGSLQKMARGTEIADQTGAALQKIVAGVGQVTQLVGEIATATKEQAQGLGECNHGLGQIDQVTQQTTANAEQSAATSEELSRQAERLRQMLVRFKLAKTLRASQPSAAPKPQAAPAAPFAWGGALKEAIPSKNPAPVAIALDDEEFGRY
ncbi:hypothetical protein DESUT3_37140 [Desulfuromonas versatilis]|uniref:Methyl-accepting chemotaxis sensory transducer n=1 Tax=Desulfuromonas versatilis TaxID=2802975 RepID=A0ABM8HXF2_9BACT|nr:HAMP domain-containing methyl-accepting chemotaxis protein [Desulfuromonas versatilis]BCR06645.1 hypothetical protein DESUT3_37140 [Desulfuromonas versatilis]